MRKAGTGSLISESKWNLSTTALSPFSESKLGSHKNLGAASSASLPATTAKLFPVVGPPARPSAGPLLAPQTARACSKGSRPVITNAVPCALLLGTRLDLIWTVEALGFAPSHIHLRDASLEPTVRHLLPAATVCRAASPAWQQSLPPVAFVQGHAHSFPFLFDVVDYVFATKARSRSSGRGPPGWDMLHTSATHASVGGVTDTTDRCYLWSRARTVPQVRSIDIPSAIARDVHSVVSDVVSGTPSRGPLASRLSKPVVTELRPGLYHAGGLFPCDTTRPHFRVRSVFSPTRWCDRRLTLSERAAVYDVPHHVVTALPPALLARILVHPGRTLERCIHGLLAHAGILDRGGLLHFDRDARTVVPTDFPVALEPTTKKQEDLGPEAVEVETVDEKEEDTGMKDQKEERRDLKATKADDAEVPVWLWNEAVLEDLADPPALRGHNGGTIDAAMDTIRVFLLRLKCKRGATRSFFSFVRAEHPGLHVPSQPTVTWDPTGGKLGLGCYQWIRRGGKMAGRKLYCSWFLHYWEVAKLERRPGWDALRRLADSSWWEWDEGSAPLYWRWPAEYRTTIRDGLEIWMCGPKPKYQKAQRPEKDRDTHAKVVKKLDKVRKRKYIAPGTVRSLTDFFNVPKGEDDIRIVYNGTSSGLNDILWVPGFPMPNANTILDG
jgi:hypothetical protein